MYEDTRTKFGEEIGRWAKENWLRYLDDCYIFWIFGEGLKQFHVLLNNLNPKFRFTIEHDTKQLAFLGILVKKINDIRINDINYKVTDTRQYLDFTSNYPRHIKKNIPYNVTRRMCTTVDDEETRDTILQQLSQILIKEAIQKKIIQICLTNALDLN